MKRFAESAGEPSVSYGSSPRHDHPADPLPLRDLLPNDAPPDEKVRAHGSGVCPRQQHHDQQLTRIVGKRNSRPPAWSCDCIRQAEDRRVRKFRERTLSWSQIYTKKHSPTNTLSIVNDCNKLNDPKSHFNLIPTYPTRPHTGR